MKVYSALPDSPPPRLEQLDVEKDKAMQQQKITYPFQEELKRVSKSDWVWCFLICISFSDKIYNLYTPEDFFYPCSYANSLSINETLQLQAQLNETPQNTTEKFSKLTETFNYHKNHWTECFNLNSANFDQKLAAMQMIASIFGFAVYFYQIYICHKYISKLKKLNLTEEQKEAYEKDWKGFLGIKAQIIYKYFMLFIFILRFSTYSLKYLLSLPPSKLTMPFFK